MFISERGRLRRFILMIIENMVEYICCYKVIYVFDCHPDLHNLICLPLTCLKNSQMNPLDLNAVDCLVCHDQGAVLTKVIEDINIFIPPRNMHPLVHFERKISSYSFFLWSLAHLLRWWEITKFSPMGHWYRLICSNSTSLRSSLKIPKDSLRSKIGFSHSLSARS